MTYETKEKALAAKEAGEISFTEFMRVCSEIDKAAGPVGVWSGHDAITVEIPRHPDADKEPSDTVSGPSITARKLAWEGKD